MGEIEECLVKCMNYYTSINYFDVYNKLPKLVYILMNINWNLIKTLDFAHAVNSHRSE